MLLLIDAGNTRIKWALADAVPSPEPANLGAWIQSGSLSHQEFFNAAHSPWSQFTVPRVLLSNVAGNTLRDQLARSLQPQHGVAQWVVAQAQLAGIKNGYRNPAQLGSDRFASAIAARALFPDQALIIATCGTALTIDAVTAEGVFTGGMIAPGLQLMTQSLAHLPALSGNIDAHMAARAGFANHTQAAIVSGCLAAQAGAIEYAVRELAISTESDPLCVVSGGAAKYIVAGLNLPYKLIDNLVLIGLQVIASC